MSLPPTLPSSPLGTAGSPRPPTMRAPGSGLSDAPPLRSLARTRDTGEVDASAARELLNTMRHFDDHKGRVGNFSNKRRRVQSGLGNG